MKKIFYLVIILLSFNTSLMAEKSLSEDDMLEFKLEAKDEYIVSQPVMIKFTLENLSDKKLWVLTWNTPLEGVKNNIFQLVCNGQDIVYEGPMVKRGKPGTNDYVCIDEGGKISAEIDLATIYNLSLPGTCHLAFRGQIQSLVIGDHLSIGGDEEKRLIQIPGNTVNFLLTR
jgi:hypothetical protein